MSLLENWGNSAPFCRNPSLQHAPPAAPLSSLLASFPEASPQPGRAPPAAAFLLLVAHHTKPSSAGQKSPILAPKEPGSWRHRAGTAAPTLCPRPRWEAPGTPLTYILPAQMPCFLQPWLDPTVFFSVFFHYFLPDPGTGDSSGCAGAPSGSFLSSLLFFF